MTAFVTGATGFLGRHLCNSLVEDDWEVIALEHNVAGVDPHGEMTAVCGDVRDLAFLRQVLSRYEVDTVYHLAAQTQVTLGHADPAAVFDTNVRGTWTVLEACRLEKVRRIVVASSDKVYGECENAKEYTDEAHASTPLAGICPYSTSKVCTDWLATCYGVNHHMPIAITRCANIYGPGDTHWRRLVPGAIKAKIRGETFLLRTDGSGVRDYLYIDDAVAAYKMLGAFDTVGPFNFSGGEPKTVSQVLSMLDVSWETDEKVGPPELKHQTLCCDKAKKVLGWKPTVGMEEGLTLAIEWYKRYL